MAIFTGKVVDAYYFSEDYKTIKVEVEDKERKIVFAHFVEADPNDGEYKALVDEGYTPEILVERTAEFKRSASKKFGSMVNNLAAKLAKQWADDWAPKMAEEQIRSYWADQVRAKQEELERKVTELASQRAKEMLGTTTMQEEKERLLREKQELENQRDKLKNREKELQTSITDKEDHLVGLDQTVKIQTNKADSIIFDFIHSNNSDKDELFKFKLWALDLDEIKKAPKETKSAIRKVKKITSGIAIVDKFLND